MESIDVITFDFSDIERSLKFGSLYLIKEPSQAMCYYQTLIGNRIWGV